MPKETLQQLIEATYADLDKRTERIVEEVKSPCKKGCANCCYMLCTAGGIEGFNIASFLLQILEPKHLKEVFQDLREMALRSSYPGMTNKNYFNKQIRCCFLSANNTCAIYPVRPAACRFHIVISPKENCSPVALDTTIRAIDLRQFESVIWELDTKANGGVPMIAPIPIVVLVGLHGILSRAKSPEGKDLLKDLNRACEGVLSPDQWMEQHGFGIAESTAKGTSVIQPLTPR